MRERTSRWGYPLLIAIYERLQIRCAAAGGGVGGRGDERKGKERSGDGQPEAPSQPVQTLAVGLPDQGATSPPAPELSHLGGKVSKREGGGETGELVTSEASEMGKELGRDTQARTSPRNVGRADGEKERKVRGRSWRINDTSRKSPSGPSLAFCC